MRMENEEINCNYREWERKDDDEQNRVGERWEFQYLRRGEDGEWTDKLQRMRVRIVENGEKKYRENQWKREMNFQTPM